METKILDLAAALNGPDDERRLQAPAGLMVAAISNSALVPFVVPPLLRALEDEHRGVRAVAAKSLAELAPLEEFKPFRDQAVVQICRVLNDIDIDVRFEVAVSLVRLDEFVRSRNAFLEVLNHPEENLENTSAVYYWIAEKSLVDFLPILIEQIWKCPARIARSAAAALVRIQGSAALRVATELLSSCDAGKRSIGADVAAMMGQSANVLLAVLGTLATSDADEDVRIASVNALGKVAAELDDVKECLWSALRLGEPRSRLAAAISLMRLGEEDAYVVELVERSLDCQDRQLSLALLANNTPRVLARFIRTFGDIIERSPVPGNEADPQSALAAECLGKSGKPALPTVLKILRLPRLEPHFWSLYALQIMGVEANGALRSVISVLDNMEMYRVAASRQSDFNFRLHAIQGAAPIALGKIVCRGDNVAMPYLVSALSSENELVRDAALEGLASISGRPGRV